MQTIDRHSLTNHKVCPYDSFHRERCHGKAPGRIPLAEVQNSAVWVINAEESSPSQADYLSASNASSVVGIEVSQYRHKTGEAYGRNPTSRDAN